LIASKNDETGDFYYTAHVTSNSEELKAGGLKVSFKINGSYEASAITDEAGTAVLTIQPPPSVAAQKTLDEESAKHPWLTNAGDKKFAQNACLIVLAGTLLSMDVTVVVGSTLLGGPAGGAATATLCIQTSPGAVGGMLLTCAAFVKAEQLVNTAPFKRLSPAVPAQAPLSKTKVDAASDRSHESLDDEARKNEAAGSQPADPGGDPDPDSDEEKNLEKSVEKPRPTAKEAEAAAKELGYDKKIPAQKAPFNSHGKPVFQNGNKYITPDADGHNGGIWKMFNRAGQRLGTFDKNLVRIGD
jgi:hypothetical protein